MTLRELMEKRAALVGKMRALNDAPAGEGGDLSDDQAKQFAELRADLEKTDKAIDRQRAISKVLPRRQTSPPPKPKRVRRHDDHA